MDRSASPWRALDPDPATAAGGPRDPALPAGQPGQLGGSWLAFAALAVSGVFAVGTFALIASGGGGLNVEGGVEVATGGASGERSSTIGGPDVVVEVTGAVAHPGVYRLPSGTRLGEAIERAGGYGPRVDTGRAERELNLAAVVGDGDRVVVPSRDDPAGESVPGPKGGSSGGLIDLNSASQAELETLPGIGPVTAAKIIAAREEQPFNAVDELRGRKLVGEKTFADLAELITVR
ncbi:MAG TPA: ComEA family DNA-binding protein [Candidatus Limnocylindrales bacterium]|jgi:competence protein ComEA